MGCDVQQLPGVLVGASFAHRWGNNPIEPAMRGSAIRQGPDMLNCEAGVEELRSAKASVLVRNSEETAQVGSNLFADPASVRTLAQAAHRVAEENAGVIDRIMERINAMISEPESCKRV